MKKKTKKQQLQWTHLKRGAIIASIGLTICLVIAYGLLKLAPTPQPQHLVTFYDRGTEHSVLTTASTVEGALASAKIAIDPHDVIEPEANTKLIKSYIDIIIYRSRPVTVVDGARRQTVMTSLQSANGILEAAGLKALGPKDKTTFSQADLLLDGTGAKLTVSRAIIKTIQPVVFQPKPNALTRNKGAQVYIDSNGVAHRETYYDLPMNRVISSCGATNSYTIRSDGAKIDQDGYILVAANLAAYPRCTVVDTSMGPGKVYDTGGFAARYPYGFDLATDWTNNNGI